MKVTSTHTINAPVDAVWALMGEQFADVADWSDTITHSSLEGPLTEGSIRTCDLKPTPSGLTQIKEKITTFDRSRRAMGFDIVAGLPGFMKYLNSEWRFEADGPSRTKAINTLTIRTAWYMAIMSPMIRSQFGKTIKHFIGEIETAARGGGSVEPMVAAG